jgi:hypothetical protein
MLKELLKMFGCIIGFILVFWLIYPLLFAGEVLSWAYFITYTIVNIGAILLSWAYFDNTRCYKHEGNPIAMIGYFLYGHTITHILLIIFRLVFNLFYFFSAFGIDMSAFGFSFVFPPQNPFSLSIPIGIFATELVFNIYAIGTGWDQKCITEAPAICKMHPEWDLPICREYEDR